MANFAVSAAPATAPADTAAMWRLQQSRVAWDGCNCAIDSMTRRENLPFKREGFESHPPGPEL
jgi:hypothetical protein